MVFLITLYDLRDDGLTTSLDAACLRDPDRAAVD